MQNRIEKRRFSFGHGVCPKDLAGRLRQESIARSRTQGLPEVNPFERLSLLLLGLLAVPTALAVTLPTGTSLGLICLQMEICYVTTFDILGYAAIGTGNAQPLW